MTKIKGNEIKGHLDIITYVVEDDFEGELSKWNEISIHGDPEGLRSLANLLIELADLNQEQLEDKQLPVGAREHYHLRPGFELSLSSDQVTVGRMDAKGTHEFYESYIPKV